MKDADKTKYIIRLYNIRKVNQKLGLKNKQRPKSIQRHTVWPWIRYYVTTPTPRPSCKVRCGWVSSSSTWRVSPKIWRHYPQLLPTGDTLIAISSIHAGRLLGWAVIVSDDWMVRRWNLAEELSSDRLQPRNVRDIVLLRVQDRWTSEWVAVNLALPKFE